MPTPSWVSPRGDTGRITLDISKVGLGSGGSGRKSPPGRQNYKVDLLRSHGLALSPQTHCSFEYTVGGEGLPDFHRSSPRLDPIIPGNHFCLVMNSSEIYAPNILLDATLGINNEDKHACLGLVLIAHLDISNWSFSPAPNLSPILNYSKH